MLPTLRRSRDPFDTFLDMSREMDRVLSALPSWMTTRDDEAVWSWPAEVVETSEEIRFSLETPGFKPDDLDIRVEDNVLTVSGERKVEKREGEDKGEYRVFERRYGRFERSFMLPRNVKADRVKADYEHGVLNIRLPKTEESKARHIPISTPKQVSAS